MTKFDFMLNDIVSCQGGVFIITCNGFMMEKDNGRSYSAIGVGISTMASYIVPITCIEGIRITESFLKNNGFTYCGMGRYVLEISGRYGKRTLQIRLLEDEASVKLDYIWLCNIRYVHEIQHVFKLISFHKEIVVVPYILRGTRLVINNQF